MSILTKKTHCLHCLMIILAGLMLGLMQLNTARAEEPIRSDTQTGVRASDSGVRNDSQATDRESLPLSDLPQPLQYKVSELIGADREAYHIEAAGHGLQASCLAHGLTTEFGPDGIAVQMGSARLGMSLLAYGRGGRLQSVAATTPQAESNRVEYQRGPLTEWYINGPLGLQQGFTMATRPDLSGSEHLTGLDGLPLMLVVSVEGQWQAELATDGRSLILTGPDGTSLRYGGLYVYDTEGQELPAHFIIDHSSLETRLQTLHILIDDAGATYPLTIDPFIQQAKLTASDGEGDDDFGISIAISGDTVVVGAVRDDIGGVVDQGSAYVFVKLGDGWGDMTQAAKLTASDGAADDEFGISVAISGDTVVVGAVRDDIGGVVDQGSAYIFVKPGGGWSGTLNETAKLVASDGATFDFFGGTAISGDTAVVGAEGDDAKGIDSGSAYVFVKPGGGWSGTLNETAKLTASDGAPYDGFSRVAISGDTVVVGAIEDDDKGIDSGSAYVFVKPGGGWSGTLNETAKLTASDGAAYDRFGRSVAIGGDTVVVGADLDDIDGNYNYGSAYVFVKPGSGWSGMLNETAKLIATDGAPNNNNFGISVAIGGDTVVVGAWRGLVGNNFSQGSAYVFVKPGGGWSGTLNETAKLTASDGAASDLFGRSVAISGDTVVVGAWQDDIGSNVDQGSAYVFGAAPGLSLTKSVDDYTPQPDQTLTYTIVVRNSGTQASGTIRATNAVISDSLPISLTFVGPVTIEGTGGTPGNSGTLPILASGLTISPSTIITVTFPVMVSSGVADGTVIANTAAVTSAEVTTPVTGTVSVTIGGSRTYLPVILKN
jgi:uncharacterized repeat protein (TIGR01451 family)